MKAIIWWQLKQRRSFIIGWAFALVALIAALMAVYPSIRNHAPALNKTLNSLPEALRALKANSNDLLSPTGYLNSQLYYATFPLMFGIMSISLGSSLLAHDEENHTLELLLARPISRSRVLLAKALSGVTIVSLVGTIATTGLIAMGSIVKLHVGIAQLITASGYVLLLSLAFGAVAFTLTAVDSTSRKFSLGMASLFAVGGYIFASLSGLAHWIQTPAKLLPYYYYKPYDILNGHVSIGLTVYLLAVVGLGTIVSWLAFRRRDIA